MMFGKIWFAPYSQCIFGHCLFGVRYVHHQTHLFFLCGLFCKAKLTTVIITWEWRDQYDEWECLELRKWTEDISLICHAACNIFWGLIFKQNPLRNILIIRACHCYNSACDVILWRMMSRRNIPAHADKMEEVCGSSLCYWTTSLYHFRIILTPTFNTVTNLLENNIQLLSSWWRKNEQCLSVCF